MSRTQSHLHASTWTYLPTYDGLTLSTKSSSSLPSKPCSALPLWWSSEQTHTKLPCLSPVPTLATHVYPLQLHPGLPWSLSVLNWGGYAAWGFTSCVTRNHLSQLQAAEFSKGRNSVSPTKSGTCRAKRESGYIMSSLCLLLALTLPTYENRHPQNSPSVSPLLRLWYYIEN